jgi:hypothetical protein
MSPAEISVSIERDIYEYLKERSTFEDTVSTVLRRELHLPTPSERLLPEESGREGPSLAAAQGHVPQRQEEMKRDTRRTRGSTPKSAKPRRARAAAGVLLPETEYHRPILEILVELGKSAPKRAVIDELGRRLESRLMEADRDTLASGIVRWESRAQFARLRLADRGYIEKNSPRGTWAITPEGIQALEEAKV